MESISNKSRTAALLLAFFLGAFGAHRFYVGRKGSAIAMLLISLTFIGAIVTVIWAWIDIITILTGSFVDKFNYKLKDW